MLNFVHQGKEHYDYRTNTFFRTKEYSYSLEHSLVAVAKWEAKWHKPFLTDEPRTREELLSYIQCMDRNDNPEEAYKYLETEQINRISDYISDPMTASCVTEAPSTQINGEQITSELMYYWMVALQIPFECQYWHLNRLIMLVRICNVKNSKQQKRPMHDVVAERNRLNAARRAKYHTKG